VEANLANLRARERLLEPLQQLRAVDRLPRGGVREYERIIALAR
jgi:hypothetical protein